MSPSAPSEWVQRNSVKDNTNEVWTLGIDELLADWAQKIDVVGQHAFDDCHVRGRDCWQIRSNGCPQLVEYNAQTSPTKAAPEMTTNAKQPRTRTWLDRAISIPV